jgi:hypothetical protein
MEATKQQRKWIPSLIEKYQIKTIADIGAGDMNWIRHTDLRGAEYSPFDLVPRRAEVTQFDIVRQVPARYDMIMCLWVLNHMPFENCRAALKNIVESGAHYLLMTHRPVWLKEQPPEIDMPFLEEIVITEKKDSIRLIDLWAI